MNSVVRAPTINQRGPLAIGCEAVTALVSVAVLAAHCLCRRARRCPTTAVGYFSTNDGNGRLEPRLAFQRGFKHCTTFVRKDRSARLRGPSREKDGKHTADLFHRRTVFIARALQAELARMCV